MVSDIELPYSSNALRNAWVDALLSLWERVILDIQPGREDNREFIERFFLENNHGAYWPSLAPYDKEDEYHEWCGLGPAWAGLYLLGDHLAENACVDARVDPAIAYFCLPGTGRIDAPGKWDSAGKPMPKEVDPHDVRRGDYLVLDTSGSGRGNHFALADSSLMDGEWVRTVECNAYGILGDETYGEGIVRRYYKTVPYTAKGDEPKQVTPRHVESITHVCRLTAAAGHFVGSAVAAA